MVGAERACPARQEALAWWWLLSPDPCAVPAGTPGALVEPWPRAACVHWLYFSRGRAGAVAGQQPQVVDLLSSEAPGGAGIVLSSLLLKAEPLSHLPVFHSCYVPCGRVFLGSALSAQPPAHQRLLAAEFCPAAGCRGVVPLVRLALAEAPRLKPEEPDLSAALSPRSLLGAPSYWDR